MAKIILIIFTLIATISLATFGKGEFTTVSPAVSILMTVETHKTVEMRKRINYSEYQCLGDFGVKYLHDYPVETGKNRMAIFICSCGRGFNAYISDVKTNHTKSCGCMVLKHGLSRSKEYVIWNNIKARCLNKHHNSYPDYGGRGISMDADFVDNPELFVEYIKTLPNSNVPNLTIDRINNELNYERGNLRWETRNVQNTNQRKRKNKSSYTGIKKRNNCKFESGINYKNKYYYLGIFYSIEEALNVRNKYITDNNLTHSIQLYKE